jgi:hypothetical protein
MDVRTRPRAIYPGEIDSIAASLTKHKYAHEVSGGIGRILTIRERSTAVNCGQTSERPGIYRQNLVFSNMPQDGFAPKGN